MRKSGFLDGLIFGIICGAVGALLFAPQSGVETRRKIKKFSEENEGILGQAGDNTEDLISKTKEAIEEGFEKISDMIENNKSHDNPDVVVRKKKEA